MTENLLDNMLGLVEMAIASAHGKPPVWCAVECGRMRHASGRRESAFQLAYKFLGDRVTHKEQARSLSELLGKISAGKSRQKDEAVGVDRRSVLIHKQEAMLT